MKEYNVDKFKIKNIIFQEVSEDTNWNSKMLHKRLVELLADELGSYVNIEDFVKELKNLGVFNQIKINIDDLKKIAIDNLAIKAKKDNEKKISNSYNLMPLLNINLDAIKEDSYYDIMSNLLLQIKSIINNPLDDRIKGIVETSFRDGKIFDELIQSEEYEIEKEKNNGGNYDDSYIIYCKKNKAVYEGYREDKSLDVLINDIVRKIKQKKMNYLFNEDSDVFSFIRDIIEIASRNIDISMDDVEDYIAYDNNYKHVVASVPYDEFLELIEEVSRLKYERYVPLKQAR